MRMIRTIAAMVLAASVLISAPAAAVDEPMPVGYATVVDVGGDAFDAADAVTQTETQTRTSQTHANRLSRVVAVDVPGVASLRICAVGEVALRGYMVVLSPSDPPVPRSVA